MAKTPRSYKVTGPRGAVRYIKGRDKARAFVKSHPGYRSTGEYAQRVAGVPKGQRAEARGHARTQVQKLKFGPKLRIAYMKNPQTAADLYRTVAALKEREAVTLRVKAKWEKEEGPAGKKPMTPRRRFTVEEVKDEEHPIHLRYQAKATWLSFVYTEAEYFNQFRRKDQMAIEDALLDNPAIPFMEPGSVEEIRVHRSKPVEET